MTWRNFTAYFDPHLWVRDPLAAWVSCTTCNDRRSMTWMATHERHLNPEWWLLPDGSIRIGD